jgi:hypothetical protein
MPDEIVDAIHAQMQSITKLQIQAMDQIMDAWEEQIKTPNPMTASPAAMLSKLKSWAGLRSGWELPYADVSQVGPMNPFELWMQFAEQWQKASVVGLTLQM